MYARLCVVVVDFMQWSDSVSKQGTTTNQQEVWMFWAGRKQKPTVIQMCRPVR